MDKLDKPEVGLPTEERNQPEVVATEPITEAEEAITEPEGDGTVETAAAEEAEGHEQDE